MTAETILYIIITALVAFAITVFMYAYRTKYNTSLKWILGTLRFIALFALFLLLVNPKFRTETYTLEKPQLTIVVDESSSMTQMADSLSIANEVNSINDNQDLQSKFDITTYGVGTDFNTIDTLSFQAKQSRLEKAFTAMGDIAQSELTPLIIITDGNQTYGKDYEFEAQKLNLPVYSIVVGDTTQYADLRLEQVNANRYSFLRNEFPVEAVAVYNGKEPVDVRMVVRKDGQIVYSESTILNLVNNSKTFSFTLPSSAVGIQRYAVTLEPFSGEKNTQNNTRIFAVEVIDQATKIALISDVIHPDLGALKKSIETNEQRSVTILKPIEVISQLDDFQLAIVYQPNRNYSSLFQALNDKRKNYLLITGTKTDWNILNRSQSIFQKEVTNVAEDVTGSINLNYSNFALDDFGVRDYPPLQTSFGELQINVPAEILLNQEINGFSTNAAMLATVDLNGVRSAIWDSEGLWKWRAHSYRDSESFENFDTFFGKLIQYLASHQRRSRLEVSHETFYYNNNPIKVSSQYFDQNYQFDSRAQLEIRVRHLESEEETVIPMLLKNNYYEVDLNNLKAGDYAFTIYVKGETISRSGSFSILDYNVEQQFMNANVTKLQRVATHTGGKTYLLGQADQLIQDLLENQNYKPIQKSQRKIVPLIDWKYLLILIVLALAVEWFTRKYNGLI